MNIKFHRKFKKSYSRQPSKIKTKFKECLANFIQDQFHYSLNNHALIGKFKGWRSINITGDVRVHYLEISNNTVVLMNIGTHAELY